MKQLSSGLAVMGLLLITAMGVEAQGQGTPGQGAPAGAGAPGGQGRGRGSLPAPTNLQVLPKDMMPQQVLQIMQGFTQGLGVTCGHCHLFAGQGSDVTDLASDAKPQKNIARAMMRMTQDINAKLPVAVGKAPDQTTRVQCATCHRGAATPVLQAAPAAPGRQGSAPPA